MIERKFTRGQDEIQYLELGRDGGIPVLFFHGFPGTGTQALIFERYLESHKLHVIAPGRPGYGGSTASKAPNFKTFLVDCLTLASGCGWERFHVVGLSGGGPYARALAKLAPDRVLSCICIAGLGLLDDEGLASMRRAERALLRLFRHAPRLVMRSILRKITQVFKPRKIMAHLLKTLPAADREQLADPQVQELLLESFEQGLAQREAGVFFDLQNYLHNGPDTIGDFKCPLIFFHGGLDTIVPLGMSEKLHALIPGAELIVLPEDGHYSLAVRGAIQVADRIVELNTRA